MQKFLNDFRGDTNPATGRLDGVALVIQPLLVDTHGEVEPAKIVTDVQFRMFQKRRGKAQWRRRKSGSTKLGGGCCVTVRLDLWRRTVRTRPLPGRGGQ